METGRDETAQLTKDLKRLLELTESRPRALLDAVHELLDSDHAFSAIWREPSDRRERFERIADNHGLTPRELQLLVAVLRVDR